MDIISTVLSGVSIALTGAYVILTLIIARKTAESVRITEEHPTEEAKSSTAFTLLLSGPSGRGRSDSSAA